MWPYALEYLWYNGNNLNKKNDPTHTNFPKFLQTRTQNEHIYIFSAKILEKKCHHLHLQPYFVDVIFEVEKFNIFLYEFFSTYGDFLSPLSPPKPLPLCKV